MDILVQDTEGEGAFHKDLSHCPYKKYGEEDKVHHDEGMELVDWNEAHGEGTMTSHCRDYGARSK